jgi:hypothetical protein
VERTRRKRVSSDAFFERLPLGLFLFLFSKLFKIKEEAGLGPALRVKQAL